MEELKRKYAKFLIEGCLRLNGNDKLFIIGSSIIEDFIALVREEAEKIGIKDIQIFKKDIFRERELYLTKSYDEIIESGELDNAIYNKMAREGYAFLNLSSPVPNFFSECSSEVMGKVNAYLLKNIREYKEYQLKGLIKWNISAVPNQLWAEGLEVDVSKLWDLVLDICLIKGENPIKAWEDKMTMLKMRAQYLNDLDIDYLIYKNKLGTNLKIGLPKNYLFQSADGNNIVNMPTEEVFTSPDRLRVDGIVYSSKVLVHNNNLIGDFWLKFQDGKVVDYDAKIGKDYLKAIFEVDTEASFLGEVALVDYSSPISATGFLFKNTLYDENASCHLALGASFAECIKGGLNMSIDELFSLGLNQSNVHVDFFIGTSDLEIIAVLRDGRKEVIMNKGDFVRQLKK